MKSRRHQEQNKTYRIITVHFPENFVYGKYTVFSLFSWLEENFSSVSFTNEEYSYIKKNYFKKKISTVTDFVNIYCKCTGYDLLSINIAFSGPIDYYTLTLAKYE